MSDEPQREEAHEALTSFDPRLRHGYFFWHADLADYADTLARLQQALF